MAGGNKAEEEASVLLLMELSVLTARDNRVEEGCNVCGVFCESGSTIPQEKTGLTNTTTCISRVTSSDGLTKYENDDGCGAAAMVLFFPFN